MKRYRDVRFAPEMVMTDSPFVAQNVRNVRFSNRRVGVKHFQTINAV